MKASQPSRSRCKSGSRKQFRSRRIALEQLEDRSLLAALGAISLANPAAAASVTADNHSSQASVSADGRYVVFLSDATNLVRDQLDTSKDGVHFKDVFLLDRSDNTMRLVSGSQGSQTKTGNNDSVSAVISADGKYVAFTSHAHDLVVGQNEPEGAGNFGFLDLFLYNVDTRATILVSHASNSATTPANHSVVAGIPSISADGRRIAFASRASNMVSGDAEDNGADVFLFDRGDSLTAASIKFSDSFGVPAGDCSRSRCPIGGTER